MRGVVAKIKGIEEKSEYRLDQCRQGSSTGVTNGSLHESEVLLQGLDESGDLVSVCGLPF
jgi:hypothetical protein